MAGGETRRCFRQRPGLLVEEFEDELVVCDPEQEEVVVLNPMAAAIWELCDGTRTVEEIAEEVVAALPADRGQVLSDVESFIGDMTRRGFVVSDGAWIVPDGAGMVGPRDAAGVRDVDRRRDATGVE